MKKIITSAVAASILLGSAVSATAAPVLPRDAATVTDAEGLEGESGILYALLAAAAVIAGIIIIESGEDDDDLPTSP